jgi:Spy/CpxP family protein refolding chaperone
MGRVVPIVALGLVLAAGGATSRSFAQSPPGHGHDHGAAHGAPVPPPPGGAPPAPGDLPHHAIVQMYDKAFAENLAAGRGFGMAFVADQNGYPGPLHVLELTDQLKLTADQETKVLTMLHEMFTQSRPKGARLLEAEARLRALFSGGRADDASVRTAVAAVEAARAEVRLVHLSYHLKTRDVLTPEQRRLYHEARWGEQGSMRVRDREVPEHRAPGK